MKSIVKKQCEKITDKVMNVAADSYSWTSPWGWYEPKVPEKLIQKQKED